MVQMPPWWAGKNWALILFALNSLNFKSNDNKYVIGLAASFLAVNLCASEQR